MRPNARQLDLSVLLGVVIALFLNVWLSSCVLAQVARTPRAVYVPNECLIHVKSGTTLESVRNQVARMGATLVSALPLSGYYVIRMGTSGSSSGSRRVNGSPRPRSLALEWTIDRWQPNYIKRASVTEPGDPLWLDGKLWDMVMIHMPEVWDFQKGSASVIVAVNDTGVAQHPDLEGRVLRSQGYDFIDNDAIAEPEPGPEESAPSHGTHVAGTIAAQGDNGVGLCGVCWDNVQILPVRVLGPEGGTSATCVSGLSWAKDKGADVVNMSYGASFGDDVAEHEKLAELNAAGIILVASAGNDGESSHDVGIPARYDECIAVAAVGPTETIAPYSSYGPNDEVDIAAPGGDAQQGLDACIWSSTVSWTDNNAATPVYGYDGWQGTSMAAPHVAGAAAILLSNGVPASEVRSRLVETARRPITGVMETMKFGAGIIDVKAALASASIRIEKPVKGSTVLSNGQFKISIRGLDEATIKVYLDYPDEDNNYIPDDLVSAGDAVIVDSTNISDCMNPTDTALEFNWPLVGRSLLSTGRHIVYATGNSSVDGSTVSDWGVFYVSNRVIKAGRHLFSFPYWRSATETDAIGTAILPSDILRDAANPDQKISFSGTGVSTNSLFRWLPATSVYRNSPWFAYREGKSAADKTLAERLAWDNPADFSWYTGGGFSSESPDVFKFPAGSGFWLTLSRDAVIDETLPKMAVTDAFNIYLYNGWNLIGNPFPQDTYWGTASFTYRGTGPKTLAEATVAGWVKPYMFRYDTSLSRNVVMGVDEPMEPYCGYWLRANVGTTTYPLLMTVLPL